MVNSILIYDSYDLDFGDVFGLAKINGFKIYQERFNEWNNKLVLGGIKVNKKERFITINSEISNKMKNYIVAHSMAHYFLHLKENEDFETVEILGETTIGSSSDLEKEANKLACELLINKELLNNEINKYKIIVDESRLLRGVVADSQIINEISDKYLIPISVLKFMLDDNYKTKK